MAILNLTKIGKDMAISIQSKMATIIQDGHQSISKIVVILHTASVSNLR